MTIQTTIVKPTAGRKRPGQPWRAWLAESPAVYAEGGTRETALHKLRTRIASRPGLTKRFRARRPVIEEMVV